MKSFVLNPATRTGLAALVLAWLCMRSASGLPAPAPVPAGGDPVARYLKNFEAAAQYLPAHGRIAYLSATEDPMAAQLAQHALVPRILVPSVPAAPSDGNCAYVLAYAPGGELPAGRISGLELVGDADHGIRVYRRLAP